MNISNGDIAEDVISNVSTKSDAKASIYLWMEIFGNIIHLRKREMVTNDVLEYTYWNEYLEKKFSGSKFPTPKLEK